VSGAAAAQQQAPTPAPAQKGSAQAEAGDPQADTSPSTVIAPSTDSSPAPPTPPAAKAAAAPAQAGHAPAPASANGQKSAAKVDRLDLGTATVTGDREQPKVMYIVPWKRSDIGDLTGKPMNSLVDEILAPVDRDVFKREVVYYHAVQADASQNGAPPKPAQQGEK
jgi:hypothetical protein